MRQKIHSLTIALAAACALAGITGCSSIDSSVQRIGNWAGDTRAALPLLPAHTVHREQSYPVSSQAPIYVQGSDPVLVGALARELRLYFGSVALLQGTEPQSSGGFVLILHSASAAEQDHAQPVQTRYNRQMQISISDRNSNATFDRLTIDLFSAYQSDSAVAQKKIQRAFKQAAALLAGSS